MDPIEDTMDSLDLAIPLPPHVRGKVYALLEILDAIVLYFTNQRIYISAFI